MVRARWRTVCVVSTVLVIAAVTVTALRLIFSIPPVRTVLVGRAPVAIALDTHTGRVFVANNESETVSVLDAGSGVLLHTVRLDGQPTTLAVDEGAGRVIVDCSETAACLLNADTGAVVRTSQTLIVMRDGEFVLDARSHQLLNSGTDGGVDVLSISTGRLLHSYPIGGTAGQALLDETTKRLFIWNNSARNLSTLDTQTGLLLHTVPVEKLPPPVAIRFVLYPHSQHLFAAIYRINVQDGELDLLDSRTGVRLQATALGFAPTMVASDPRTGHIFVAGPSSTNYDGTDAADIMTMVDERSGAMLRTTYLPSVVHAITVDEQRGLVFLASDDSRVRIFSTRTGLLRGLIRVGDDPDALALDEQGGLLYVANKHGGSPPVPDSLRWVPNWVRQRLQRILPRQSSTHTGSVTIIDLNEWLANHPGQH